jgi:hypothetical protein
MDKSSSFGTDLIDRSSGLGARSRKAIEVLFGGFGRFDF